MFCDVAIMAQDQSLRSFHIEAVFTSDDPMPGLVEFALIPYMTVKRGF